MIGVFRDIAYNKPGEFPYVRCLNCGLVYLQVRPTPEEIGLYYPSEYQPYRTAIQDERYPWMRWARNRNIQKYCQIVARYSAHNPGKVLDIGCSTGIFLDAMRQRTWDATGVEISQEAVAYAQQRFGLNVVQGQLEEIHFETESFDAITLWNVFEHLYNPNETLQEIQRLLKKNGILVMVFPNWDSLDHHLFGKGWIGYDTPRHLFAYPPAVYPKMIESAGLNVIHIQSAPNNYFAFAASLDNWLKFRFKRNIFVNSLVRIVNFPGMRFLVTPFIFLIDSLGLGATTLVIARKSSAG